jgi:hypothetical protein
MTQIESKPRERDCRMIPPRRTHRLITPTSCSEPDREPDVEGGKKRDNLPYGEAGCYQIEADKNGTSNLR